MKRFTPWMISSFLLLGSLQAEGFGFGVGPFSLQFDVGDAGYTVNQRKNLSDPICFAISRQLRLALTVEGKEKISSKEVRITTKKIIVEPYGFGITNDGRPILRGNILEDKLVREITVKYGEDRFSEDDDAVDHKERGFFSGWFKSDQDEEEIDIRKVRNIRVLEDSHFDAPEDFQGMNRDDVRVICELRPVAKK